MSDKLVAEGLRILKEQTRPLRPTSTINKDLVKDVFAQKSSIAQNIIPNRATSPNYNYRELQYTKDTNPSKNSLGVKRPIAPSAGAAKYMRANRMQREFDASPQGKLKSAISGMLSGKDASVNDLSMGVGARKQYDRYINYVSNNPGVMGYEKGGYHYTGEADKNIGPFSGMNVNIDTIDKRDIRTMPYDSPISKDITLRAPRVGSKGSI